MKVSQRVDVITNLVGFQACWVACVAYGQPWAAIVVAGLLIWHCFIADSKEWPLVVLFSLLGIGLDNLSYLLGYISFPDHDSLFIPTWLMLLWLAFATTLRHSLATLMRYPRVIVPLALVAAPWSYFMGHHLGSIDITGTGYLVIAFGWAILLGIFSWCFFKPRMASSATDTDSSSAKQSRS